jgi:hypothetical protein
VSHDPTESLPVASAEHKRIAAPTDLAACRSASRRADDELRGSVVRGFPRRPRPSRSTRALRRDGRGRSSPGSCRGNVGTRGSSACVVPNRSADSDRAPPRRTLPGSRLDPRTSRSVASVR